MVGMDGSGMKAFRGFGAIPSQRHGNLFARARTPLVPLCIAPRVFTKVTGGRPVGRPGEVGPRGHPRLWSTFSGRAGSPGLVPFCVLRASVTAHHA